MTAHKFIGLHDSSDYVHSVLYDIDGEEFYEDRVGVQIRACNNRIPPIYKKIREISIPKLMIQTQIRITWQLRMEVTRIRLTTVINSKLTPAISSCLFLYFCLLPHPSVLMPNPRIMDCLI
ncbi:hypothetical protein AVEN_75749-1 [Araneus ventricosus]|uniref:Uncharacterized protein n=1 Tax=Araneus ventricosus TaxID=182803 RepID=A0A4Y2T471_ARAVE|nr:hypothetical protein AVEN_75749-1 [Araneus ventricosus]